jgi:XTP/dITP diphosphohydrolase
VATGNPGKVREIQQLLGPGWKVVPQSVRGVTPVEETGATFRENALIKARHAAALTGGPALADDSGLEVDALGGAPGVRSARYAGAHATDADNNLRLLVALAGVPRPQRSARYQCALAYVSGPDDPAPLIAEGTWSGWIAENPQGSGGFGYDPLFIDQATGVSAACMGPEAKNARSHRGSALRSLRTMLADLAESGGPPGCRQAGSRGAGSPICTMVGD